MHRNHPSEFTLAAHSARPLCAPVLTYIKYAPLRCSPSHADYTTMPNSFQNHIDIIATASNMLLGTANIKTTTTKIPNNFIQCRQEIHAISTVITTAIIASSYI